MIILIHNPNEPQRLSIQFDQFTIRNHADGKSVWLENSEREGMQLDEVRLKAWLEKLWLQEF